MNMSSLLLLLLLFLNLTFNAFSEPPLPLQPAVVVGTVFCDTCFQQHLSKSPHFISGARVEVECRDEKTSKTSFKHQVTTNKKGKFKVVLPFSVAKHVKKIESCGVRLIKSSEPFCSVASSATSSSLKLKSSKKNKNGVRIFSAGFFTFKPLEQPALCNQKSDLLKSKLINPQLPFPPIVPPVIQPPSFLPPNPLQPAPLIPNPFQPPAPLIPNPFQPPAPLIPNPFQPPAPVIPNPFQPTPGSGLPLPPLPFISPSPPPPTLLPPSLVPPFLPPIPGIPSGPPREETTSPIKQSP
ncbi:actin cytoskeleton-regulatory complex protein PAN1-like [Benincasa hispida]|uniref:actin cytoskeleton-regulatory complex protein PAN1-like n=1 Tax=Benincasa hispida TaxID=102211 RepID=UPI0019004019|nr:actin cytoskeleton-regulatory complex protein PAN1-like [Benincasa hispida]